MGHLAPIKGQQDFVRAAAIVAAERNDVDFVIAGEDKSHTGEHRSAIESLSPSSNLTSEFSCWDGLMM